MEGGFSWLRTVAEDRAAVLQQEDYSTAHLPGMRRLSDGAFWMAGI